MTTSEGKPRGGTELLVEGLYRHVPKALLHQVTLSTNTPQNSARHLKPFILWEHQSYDQPSVQRLKDQSICNVIDQFIFVSEWQKEHYLKYFSIPEEKTSVIRNAIEPIPKHTKSHGRLKLIYTSTPFRGLDVLLDAFALLNRSDVELHIYSGMGLYARAHEDVRFEPLYKRARAMENVFYHGVVLNDEIRKAVQEAHIFAYPCTWEETSCLSLIEALSAGCLAVVPELGALPETASGFAQMYQYTANKQEHAERFSAQLSLTIDTFWNVETQKQLAEQKRYFDEYYCWEQRKGEWVAFLTDIIKNHG